MLPLLADLRYRTYKICYVKLAWGKLWRTVDHARQTHRISLWDRQIISLMRRVLAAFPHPSEEQLALTTQPYVGCAAAI
jgi:hypothetical protein